MDIEKMAFIEHHLENVSEWKDSISKMMSHSNYIETLNDVKLRRASLAAGENLDTDSDYDFFYKLLLENDNGIFANKGTLRDEGKEEDGTLIKAKEKFEGLIQDKKVLKALERIIMEPSAGNSENLGSTIRCHNKSKNYYIKNNWVVVNRIVAVCTDKVSSLVSRERFAMVFDWFIRNRIIDDYPNRCSFSLENENWTGKEMGEKEWYNENIHLMYELRKIFESEINNGATDMQFISMQVFETWGTKFSQEWDKHYPLAWSS